MSRLHRLTWIDAQIRARRYPNCRTIASHCEISPRQAARDIEYLRDSMGAPLRYCARRRGYYYTTSTFVVGAQLFSDEDRRDLDDLAQRYRRLGGNQGARLARLLCRISAAAVPDPHERLSHSADGIADESQGSRPERADGLGPDPGPVSPAAVAGDQADGLVLPARPHAATVAFPEGVAPSGWTRLPEPVGQGLYRIPFHESGELLGWLLGSRLPFTVAGPAWLRRRLSQHLRDICRRHDIMCHSEGAMVEAETSEGVTVMAGRMLAGVSVGRTWTSYLGAAYGVLRAAGFWEGELYQLAGRTGVAFHFIVHQQACPSSVTVYDWPHEHCAMMDRVGVHSEVFQTLPEAGRNTLDRVRAAAVDRIRASIDRGVAVVVWAPTPLLEFGLIDGYDDADEVFMVQDCAGRRPDPLLYANLGRSSSVPILSYQLFYSRLALAAVEADRSALAFAVAEWEKEAHVDPRYGSGRKGYANLAGTLARGDFSPMGLAYLLSVYADAKRLAARYLGWLADGLAWPGLAAAAGAYSRVAEDFGRMAEMVPFCGPAQAVPPPEVVQSLSRLVAGCAAEEERAVEGVRAALRS